MAKETKAQKRARLKRELKTRNRQIRRLRRIIMKARPRLAAVRRRKRKVQAAVAKLGASTKPLRERALDEATKLIGVREVGGNNRGPKVEEIIRYARGYVPEPWCVNFVIWAYGRAGSKYVKPGYTRAVRYMYPAAGVSRTGSPKPGDIVRFTFDHTGLFVRDLGNGYIETIEGNTGASGAVSDSTTGGDGVYRKRRAKSLVQDYLTVAG